MSSVPPVFKIQPTIQQYDWGTIGHNSKVAQFASTSKIPDFTIQESAPYAELWMGTHPKSPSRVLGSNQTLAEHLAANPSLMGSHVIKYFGAANGNLPFLFKVLAINKALSIQTHPDKETAEKLHAAQPDVYRDANHKPELALALTPFRALCGFLPLPRIATYIQTVPELGALIPESIANNFISLASTSTPTGPEEKAALKDVFAALITADGSIVKDQLSKLTQRYKAGGTHPEVERQEIVDLVSRLDTQFPGDIGVFCAFVLNYMELKPGEAIFLGAGEPHAYISGDIIECMANSDNVIRAGLTPKARDVPNLISGLTYIASEPNKHVIHPTPLSPSQIYHGVSKLYKPPVPEFSVVEARLPPGQPEMQDGIDGPSVAIVTQGHGSVFWETDGEKPEKMLVGQGDVFFVGAGIDLGLVADVELVVHRAFTSMN